MIHLFDKGTRTTQLHVLSNIHCSKKLIFKIRCTEAFNWNVSNLRGENYSDILQQDETNLLDTQ